VDFGTLRAEVGPEVELHGGPSAPFLADASADEVEAETVRILTSGVAQGGRFVLREGNNLAPGTPVASVRRMYDTVRRAGRYDAGGDLCILC
jgi:uroporphyrinogen-III decarboxylase